MPGVSLWPHDSPSLSPFQKSAGTSDVGSVGDNMLFSLTTAPDEQTQVFMVLDEDVSKSVVREYIIVLLCLL
jgi:hypothetical protein